MTNEQLEILLKDLESDRVERKASISDKKALQETICAFANDLPKHQQPGILFIGVNDDGTCANLPIDDRLLLTLSEMRSNGNILPFPVMIVEKRTIGGCELAVVIVEPSDAPPVRYNGRVWVRIGPRRATATAEEERRLSEKRRSRDLPFDIQTLPSATIDDLDVNLFQAEYLPACIPPEILAENQRTVAEQLASVRFVSLKPSINPTNLGILVVGKDSRQFIPGAYIQFVRYDGREITDPIKDQKEISGPLLQVLRRLDETLSTQISVASDMTTQPVEIKQPDYPLVALQQLTRNAVFHRTYEGTNAPVRLYWFNDRIEIHNPGGPFGQVNRDNFGQPGVTDYRNPNLAEVMKNLGYVQKFGMGIALARKELEKNGNPPPEFQIEDTYIVAIIRRRP